MVSTRSWFVLAALLPATSYAAVEEKRQDTTSDELISVPATTQVITSVVLQSGNNPTESASPVTVVVTRTNSASEVFLSTQTTSARLSTLTFTTTRPAVTVIVTGQVTLNYTSTIVSTPGSDLTSSQAPLNTGGSSGISEGGDGGGLSVGAKAGIGVGIAVGVIAVAAAVLVYIWYRRRRKSPLTTEPGLEKDVVPVSELHNKSKPHEAGSTALHELQVEPSELEDSNKEKAGRPPAELEGDEPRPK